MGDLVWALSGKKNMGLSKNEGMKGIPSTPSKIAISMKQGGSTMTFFWYFGQAQILD